METERHMRTRHHVLPAVGLVLLTAFLACSNSAWADYQAGWEAYDRGDYKTALKEFRPLAEEGHAAAQTTLGVAYGRGARCATGL